MVGTFSQVQAHAIERLVIRPIHMVHSNEDRTRALVLRKVMKGVPMSIRSSEAAIDEIVANCNGDLRGAVKALLLVNEQLEAEIAQLYAAAVHYGLTERGGGALH